MNLHILEHSLLEGLESTYKLLNDIVGPLNGVILIHHDVVCQLIPFPQSVSQPMEIFLRHDSCRPLLLLWLEHQRPGRWALEARIWSFKCYTSQPHCTTPWAKNLHIPWDIRFLQKSREESVGKCFALPQTSTILLQPVHFCRAKHQNKRLSTPGYLLNHQFLFEGKESNFTPTLMAGGDLQI